MSKEHRPDWYTKPPDQWPSSAREFYRLCWHISRRVQLKRARLQAGELVPTSQPDHNSG